MFKKLIKLKSKRLLQRIDYNFAILGVKPKAANFFIQIKSSAY